MRWSRHDAEDKHSFIAAFYAIPAGTCTCVCVCVGVGGGGGEGAFRLNCRRAFLHLYACSEHIEGRSQTLPKSTGAGHVRHLKLAWTQHECKDTAQE